MSREPEINPYQSPENPPQSREDQAEEMIDLGEVTISAQEREGLFREQYLEVSRDRFSASPKIGAYVDLICNPPPEGMRFCSDAAKVLSISATSVILVPWTTFGPSGR